MDNFRLYTEILIEMSSSANGLNVYEGLDETSYDQFKWKKSVTLLMLLIPCFLKLMRVELKFI